MMDKYEAIKLVLEMAHEHENLLYSMGAEVDEYAHDAIIRVEQMLDYEGIRSCD